MQVCKLYACRVKEGLGFACDASRFLICRNHVNG